MKTESEDLQDPLWRLRNLYECRQEGKGGGVVFVPRPEQEMIFKHLIEQPTVPAYIIKSRRLGLSTGICTFQADRAVFESGWRGVLIDQKQEDATKKMVEIVRFAVDSLDPALLRQIQFDKRNDSELRLRIADEKESEDSVIFATTGHRGGDCSMLHVSEWGPIAAEDVTRSNEIRSGAFPAARLGRRVVETTWKGGKGGDLWELIKPILEKDPNSEGVVYFFPWHDDPEAVKLTGEITKETEDYFMDLASKLGGKNFSPEQKKWWTSKKLEQGIFMSREYPSTLEEAFRSPVEGAILAPFIDAARNEGRIIPFPWDRSAPVHTFWDIGSPKNTRCTYIQFVGRELHAIDHDFDINLGPTARVAHMKSKGYSFGTHYLPHDADAEEKSGANFKKQLADAGLENLRVIPRCHEIWPGINKLTEILPRMVFHATACEKLVESAEQYCVKKSTADGFLTNTIVQNWACHSVDTLRMLAEAMLNNMLKGHAEVIRDTRPAHLRQKKASAGRWKG